jgi:dTDP-4-amino-4,6-dideoxygalactose transaminase
LQSALREHAVETAVHYPIPLHRHPAFRPRATWKYAPLEAERAAAEVMSLPIGPHITVADAQFVADLIANFQNSKERP